MIIYYMRRFLKYRIWYQSMGPDILEQLLGEGSYSWVYSIKNDPKYVAKVSKTANSQLSTQNIVLSLLENSGQFPRFVSRGQWLFGEGESQSCQYLVMERLGMSLQELMVLRNGRLAVSMIKNISLQLVNKILTLHQYNYIHNDIKPANIMFGAQQNRKKVYLIDFGLSKQIEGERTEGVFVGNVQYASLGKLKGNQGVWEDYEGLLWVCLWMLMGGKCSWTLKRENDGRSCSCQRCGQCLNSTIRAQIENKYNFLNSDLSASTSLKGESLDLAINIQSFLLTFHTSPHSQVQQTQVLASSIRRLFQS